VLRFIITLNPNPNPNLPFLTQLLLTRYYLTQAHKNISVLPQKKNKKRGSAFQWKDKQNLKAELTAWEEIFASSHPITYERLKTERRPKVKRDCISKNITTIIKQQHLEIITACFEAIRLQ
jgi:hypothetical protein